MGNYPVIKFVISFTLGILSQNIFNFNSTQYLIFIFSLLLILLGGTSIKTRLNPKLFYQFILIILIFSIGGLYTYLHNQSITKYPFETPKIKNAEVSGKIESINLANAKKISLEISLTSLNKIKYHSEVSKKFICNIWRDESNSLDSLYRELKVGNSICFVGTVKRANGRRNPGEFDYEKYLFARNITGIINCYKPENVKIFNRNVNYFSNLIFSIRHSIDRRIKQLHNPQTSNLLRGILLADRSEINYEIKNAFVATGVIHVLAVSGLHVGFISLIFYLVLGRVDIRIKYSLTIFGILAFLVLTGGHSSVFRASTMAIVYLIAKLTNRSTNGFNSISIAALIILLVNPNDLLNPGFQLSFSAVISILIIYPILSAKINSVNLNPIIKKILLFASVSIAAQIGTLPFTLVYFNKLSLISLFANLIVIPIIGFIVSIGILTLSVSMISISIASIFASANMFLIDQLYLFVNYSSSLSFSYLPIYNFSIFDGILFYLFLSGGIFILLKFRHKILSLISLAILSFSFLSYASLDNQSILPAENLSIVTIDVGQGDAFLIKFPNNKTALIDAGNVTEYFDNGARVIYPLLQRFGIDNIDYAFISHLDTDHYGGIVSLIKQGVVDKLYKPLDHKSIKDSIFEQYLTGESVNFNCYSNQIIRIGQCEVYILNDPDIHSYNSFDSNNKSGIIKIVYGKNSFLFVGDAEYEEEEYLIERYGKFLNSDVLKIGHHGSKSSSSDMFLDFVNPKVAIISAGVMNKFGHPSKRVLNKLSDRKIEIHRTDHEGAIILTSNGESVSNINWR